MSAKKTPDQGVDELEKAAAKPPQKARAAVELRLRHASWAEIAETLDYESPLAAQNAVEATLAWLVGAPETYVSMQKQMGMELDLVLRSLAPNAMSSTISDPSDPEPDVKKRKRIANENHLAYVKEYRQTLEQKARLFGLNAPTRVQIDSPDAAALDELVSSVVAAQRGAVPASGNIFDMELADGVYVAVVQERADDADGA